MIIITRFTLHFVKKRITISVFYDSLHYFMQKSGTFIRNFISEFAFLFR